MSQNGSTHEPEVDNDSMAQQQSGDEGESDAVDGIPTVAARPVDSDVEVEDDEDEAPVNYKLGRDITEVLDDKGHFKSTKAVSKEDYPIRSEALDKLQDLHEGFSVKKGFAQLTAEEGERYYFVSKRFIKKLLLWLQEDDTDPNDEHDLEVDNTVLFHFGTKTRVKKHLISNNTQTVSAEVWECLMKWFGGGPEVSVCARKDRLGTIRVDSNGKLIRGVTQDDMTTYRRFFFSSQTTIQEAKDEMCRVFGLDPDKTRLHDFYKYQPFSRLDKEKDLTIELGNKHLMDDNLCFLEKEGKNGKYRIEYHSYGHSGGYTRPVSMNKDKLYQSAYGPNFGVKGVVGLENIGNTCYMNSTLQCLSNIPMLKEVFLSKAFEPDINTSNPLGYDGKVAKAYHNVVTKMWAGTGNIVAPHAFKKAISKAKTIFEGTEQHDSQEFISELLDAIHEDLNRITDKPSVQKPTGDGRPDVLVAEESMKVHKMRNDSFIVDLFTGLYKSTVTCPQPTCTNVSVTFEPFTTLNLPLQTGEKFYQVVHVVHVPMNPREDPIVLDLIVPKHGPAFLLRNIIKDKVGITAKNEANKARLAEGKEVELDLDDEVKKAQWFTGEDEEDAVNYDILMYSFKNNKLYEHFEDDKNLSRVKQSTRIVTYEVFNERRFQYFTFLPDEEWKRPLEHKRAPKRRKYANQERYVFDEDDDEVQEVDVIDEAKEVADLPTAVPLAAASPSKRKPKGKYIKNKEVGLVGCPFLEGDTFHGKYNYNDIEQVIRLEFIGVDRMTWEDYQEYKLSALEQSFGVPQTDTEFTEEDFNTRQCFYLHAVADSKEKKYYYYQAYNRGPTYHTAFELQGIFFTDPNVEMTVDEVKDSVRNSVTKSTKELTPSEKASKDEQKSQGSGSKAKNKDPVSEKGGGKGEGKKNGKKFGSILGGFSPFRKNSKGKKGKSARKKSEVAEKDTKKEEKKGEKEVKKDEKEVKKEEKKVEKTEKKKSSKETKAEEPVEEGNLFRKADAMASGVMEKKYIKGTFVLRPTGKFEKQLVSGHRGYTSQFEDHDESRNPIILTGTIDNSGRYLWGKFVVYMGFTRGEFLLRKYETYNWDIDESAGELVLARTKYPMPSNRDGRLLILICHRTDEETGAHRLDSFYSIPDSFFVPANFTESDFMEAVKARYKIYIEKAFAEKNQPTKEEREEGEVDLVNEILEKMEVVRATPRFSTTYSAKETLQAGLVVDDQSDTPLQVDEDEYFVWFAIKWKDEVPFLNTRSHTVFQPLQDKESLMSLNAALDLFSVTEKLNSMNAWYCNRCKEHQEAYKSLELWSLPTVLVISFKRFSQDEGRSVADKLEIPVEFPFEMDLKSRVLSYKVVNAEMPEDVEAREAIDRLSQNLDFEYELVGVSSHIGGGLGFGHYIACAKNEYSGKWYEFDDRNVVEIEEKDYNTSIVNPEAYVLFYIKKGALEERRVEREAAEAAAAVAEAAKATEEGEEKDGEKAKGKVDKEGEDPKDN